MRVSLEALFIKSKANNRIYLNKNKYEEAEKTFLRNHHNPVPRTRACPSISRERARGARRKQLLRQFDGKGASES